MLKHPAVSLAAVVAKPDESGAKHHVHLLS